MSDPTGPLCAEELLREAVGMLALRESGHTGAMNDRIPWFTHGAVSHGENRPDCVVCQWLEQSRATLDAERAARLPDAGLWEALLDAAMAVEAMTFGRTFPAEPEPSTRDLVVFAATAGHIKRMLRKRATLATPTPAPADDLDVAWAAAEAALPQSDPPWMLTLHTYVRESDGEPFVEACAYAPMYEDAVQVFGPTPAAALRALAAAALQANAPDPQL